MGDLAKWSKGNWDKVPDLIRQDCLRELRAHVTPELLARWKKEHAAGHEIGWGEPFFHFGAGMAVRNILRRQYLDEELPPVKQPAGEMASNWDDYYMGALIELVETS